MISVLLRSSAEFFNIEINKTLGFFPEDGPQKGNSSGFRPIGSEISIYEEIGNGIKV